MTGESSEPVTPEDDTAHALARQVRVLQTHCVELELQKQRYLHRIRELESQFAGYGGARLLHNGAPGGRSLQPPTDRRAARKLATLELQHAQLQFQLQAKQQVIEEIAAQAEARLALLQQTSASLTEVHEALNHMETIANERLDLINRLMNEIESLRHAADERLASIQQLSATLAKRDTPLSNHAAIADERPDPITRSEALAPLAEKPSDHPQSAPPAAPRQHTE